MHESVDAWVGKQVSELGLRFASVLEVGSRDLNGSVRHWFAGEYVGVDVYPGEGVDVVVPEVNSLARLDLVMERVEVVVCSETLEHARRFWDLCMEMVAVLGRDGWLLLTTRANGFPDHAVPHDQHGAGGDWWRFMSGALTMLFTDLGLVDVEEWEDPQAPGVFLRGRKP